MNWVGFVTVFAKDDAINDFKNLWDVWLGGWVLGHMKEENSSETFCRPEEGELACKLVECKLEVGV